VNADTDRLYSFEISNIDSGFGSASNQDPNSKEQAGQQSAPVNNFQLPDEINIIKPTAKNNNKVEQTSNQMVPAK